MSNETKRDVLEKLTECYAEVYDAYTDETGSPYYCDDEPNYLDEYAAALPDDLPVIPKVQSDWIKQCKANDDSLSFALGDETTPIEVAKTFRVWGGYTDKNKDRWLKLQDTFARAWVLGAWRVEETGEIVKLEAEK
ncbi:hypothetical protein [Lacticaseibacillus paracasei]|jgi:hypothetical protein|uniref:hypothetical protein n=1 Tax=Lacticaseibacillus paracasei TaxID=1597 RepID=UPI00073C03C8|nr:hypothetical protein [Lacticaseibacillus paracasei]KTE98877.1 hypothetical protein AC564_1345c [Lacticaseibacillus paracasei]RND49318.1 hypothetical protein FAM18110_01087 [Lacticaseibacillus paracasei]TXJ63626.1 hypothetical protein FGO89_15460 [Lacticaseibacillus paracasei]